MRGLIPVEERVQLSQLPAADILALESDEREKAAPRLL